MTEGRLPSALLRPTPEGRRRDIQEMFELLGPASRLQELAAKYNIADIFQDNGGKILQVLIMLGLRTSGAREGHDASDEDGQEYELKTANVNLVTGFSTHHHLNHVILSKYRQVPWIFAFYGGIELVEIVAMTAHALEPLFSRWEDKLAGRVVKKGVVQDAMSHINNPKIPFKFVLAHGTHLFTKGQVDEYRGPNR